LLLLEKTAKSATKSYVIIKTTSSSNNIRCFLNMC
jgi:hypothetical protein